MVEWYFNTVMLWRGSDLSSIPLTGTLKTDTVTMRRGTVTVMQWGALAQGRAVLQ